MNETTFERTTHKTDHTKVKVGDIMAVLHFVRVDKVLKGGKEIGVKPVLSGSLTDEFYIKGEQLVEDCLSADYYKEEQTVTMTKAAELLVGSVNCPFSVCFEKQDGEERILRGLLVRPEPLLGRSLCRDLEKKEEKDQFRLVDHRSLLWIVVQGVKYTVGRKGKK